MSPDPPRILCTMRKAFALHAPSPQQFSKDAPAFVLNAYSDDAYW